MRTRRIIQQNSGPLADMAFMLLLFFLMTTTIEQETGIPTELPPVNAIGYRQGEVVHILLNSENQFMIDEKVISAEMLSIELQRKLKDNPAVTFSLRTNLDARYDAYVGLYNEVRKAYRHLYNHHAHILHGMKFNELNEAQQRNIKRSYPMRISEEFASSNP